MSAINYISNVVAGLTHRFHTRDPYDLCAALGIEVRQKDLGTDIKAYYFYQSRISTIVLNWNVTSTIQRIVLAHELGHDRLHKEIAMSKGFQEIELFDRTKPTEYEANLFAAELLIEDQEVLELLNDREMSFFDAARELYVPAALLDFKFRVMKYKGYRVEAPYIANGDFLKNDIQGCYVEDEW